MENVLYKLKSQLIKGMYHIHELPKDYDIDKEGSLYHVKAYKREFPLSIALDKLPYTRKNIPMTDVLNVSYLGIPSGGMVVNNRILKFFKKFNLDSYKEYPITIRKGDDLISNYKYIHFLPKNFLTQIELSNSIFYEQNLLKSKIITDNIVFSQYDELISFLDNLPRMHFLLSRKIQLLSSAKILDFDLVRLMPIINGIYMSENMKNEFDKENFKGLEFEKVIV